MLVVPVIVVPEGPTLNVLSEPSVMVVVRSLLEMTVTVGLLPLKSFT